jgi:hypothetical protein
MQTVPPEVWANFERRLDEARVPPAERPDYRKWVSFYLDFCHQYRYPASFPSSRGPFLAKLASKNQSEPRRAQASAAVELLLKTTPGRRSHSCRGFLPRIPNGEAPLRRAEEDAMSPITPKTVKPDSLHHKWLNRSDLRSLPRTAPIPPPRCPHTATIPPSLLQSASQD